MVRHGEVVIYRRTWYAANHGVVDRSMVLNGDIPRRLSSDTPLVALQQQCPSENPVSLSRGQRNDAR
ncbi:uncharacterized protein FOMMEDRAFT_20194 [Fomitiporia mediterranea MF3/22]|uniref:uncharacterized protein n=1 Tax=Fomitiporia mediterranea (strain MF3/22) TaxID=694068 RepID=UPI000440903C|nr:uncharacterized protein FOMMEDRAFT_20194 [Fomitiporia mediterranea MF3/22]EJD03025.1 hypothetical protein FOMMEDRAFT_20194 [Fomitiporia mediterranea MF3/22]